MKDHNIFLSRVLLKKLQEKLNCIRFVICSGSRNTPLLFEIEKLKNKEIFTFFDERAASFFALGMCQLDRKPTVVVTTSGTAVSECYSAFIEAYYSSLPLVILSADRPRRYRGSGAPQAIMQKNIFSHYSEGAFLDCEREAELNFNGHENFQYPLHVNLSLEEPAGEASASQDLVFDYSHQKTIQDEKCSHECFQQLESFVDEQTALVLSGLHPSESVVFEKLFEKNLPIYTEATSNLPKSLLSEEVLEAHYSKILRIGAVPLGKFWRNLEKNEKEVFSVSRLALSGLSKKSQFYQLKNYTPELIELLLEKLTKCSDEKSPEVELSDEEKALKELSKKIPHDALIFLGNSLPVREWTRVAEKKEHQHVFASRGANGIDGQIATFLGLSAASKNKNLEFWCVLGDLTSLYDLNSLLLAQSEALKNLRLRLVVVNNGGGKIFEKLKYLQKGEKILSQYLVQGNYQYSFELLAQAFHWSYAEWSDEAWQIQKNKKHLLLELKL